MGNAKVFVPQSICGTMVYMYIALRGKIVYMIHVSAHLGYRSRGGGVKQALGAERSSA